MTEAAEAFLGVQAKPAPTPVKSQEIEMLRAIENLIPAGRYALNFRGKWEFFKVDKGNKGTRWEGWTFLKLQAGDDFHPVRGVQQKLDVYAALSAAGMSKASAEYGHRLGICGVCGRSLTDPESIERGIGPVCVSKMGW